MTQVEKFLTWSDVDHLREAATEGARAFEQVQAVHSPKAAEVSDRVGASYLCDQRELPLPYLFDPERSEDLLLDSETDERFACPHAQQPSTCCLPSIMAWPGRLPCSQALGVLAY